MKNIAIIGGGTNGIGLLKSLLDYNYNVYVFEKNEKPGGIWYSNTFFDLKIQVNSKHYRFYDKPHKRNIHRMSGKEIQKYIQEYIDQNDLNSRVYLNYDAEIIKVNEKYKIKNKNNSSSCKILFDYVIYTGENTMRYIPDLFQNQEYSHKILYPDMLDKSLLKKLNNKKIVINGGSKSAMDMAYSLKKHTSADVTLISRGFSSFLRSSEINSLQLPDLIHASFISILNKLKITKKSFNDVLFSYNIAPELSDKVKPGSQNLLTDDEFQTLKTMKKKIYTNINISQDELILDNKEKIKYDYIFLCLGYMPTKIPFTSKYVFSFLKDDYMLGSTSPLNSHFTAYFINEYIKYNKNDFRLFFKERSKKMSFYMKVYKLIYILFDVKMIKIDKFIMFTRIFIFLLLFISARLIFLKFQKKNS